MSITHFLVINGFYTFEGHSQQIPQQAADLIELSKESNINVMEIGFNAGHSAEIFLRNNSNLLLTSFDLGAHDYTPVAKTYIDTVYPNRHTLILGDSTETVPEYIKNNVNKKFDIIFIDGGHSYAVANADVENCMKLAHKNTIVIIDDTFYSERYEHTIGPTTTWIEHLNKGKIAEINRVEYSNGRGMSWGKYNV